VFCPNSQESVSYFQAFKALKV